jgi:hypothetical protein
MIQAWRLQNKYRNSKLSVLKLIGENKIKK